MNFDYATDEVVTVYKGDLITIELKGKKIQGKVSSVIYTPKGADFGTCYWHINLVVSNNLNFSWDEKSQGGRIININGFNIRKYIGERQYYYSDIHYKETYSERAEFLLKGLKKIKPNAQENLNDIVCVLKYMKIGNPLIVKPTNLCKNHKDDLKHYMRMIECLGWGNI